MWMLKVYLMFHHKTIVGNGMVNIKIVLYFLNSRKGKYIQLTIAKIYVYSCDFKIKIGT